MQNMPRFVFRFRALFVAAGLAAIAIAAPQPIASAFTSRQAAQPATVPSDLNPLLRAPESEFRMVVQRYALDRDSLTANYFGGAPLRGFQRGGGMQQPAETAQTGPAARVRSRARTARLRRFDLEWRAALDALDATSLTPAARTDLASLQKTIAENVAALEADTGTRAQMLPLLPFAPALVEIYEARVRMADMNARETAGIIAAADKEIARVRAALEAGLAGADGGLRASAETARNAAALTDALREHLAAWFAHYDGYDPMFMWWVDMPYRKINTALEEYATLLRDRVAAAGQTSNLEVATDTIEPSPAPPVSSVPDLAMIIALPQDEMRGIVEQFRAGMGGRSGQRRRANMPPPAPPAGPEYYRAWLSALETLDFDALSRNAQVDYLYIRRTSELALTRASATPQQNIPRKTDDSGIEGAARGRDGLLLDLADELIPYTPEQLIELGNREYVWTVEEMKKASREMGFGDDWMKAVEAVKEMHVEPGRQPEVVRDMLYEAVDYLRANDLITVPQVASEALRMRMLSPQEQLTAPFFLGGAMILVAYPTSTMEYDARIQALRGNNLHFSHAVAHHEMIPGHNLVGFKDARYRDYRPTLGSTPFLGEGWPLYWETILYDKGFHDTPEERIGALFWRMHRAARIVFSMNFHMGRWSPQDCIDFLVNEVGHERDNATAEVRRSFAGTYGPLYQMAYLVGGLQIRGLRKELVDSGRMTEKAFHDEIMRQGSMPVAYLRLALWPDKLTRDMRVEWEFYGKLD